MVNFLFTKSRGRILNSIGGCRANICIVTLFGKAAKIANYPRFLFSIITYFLVTYFEWWYIQFNGWFTGGRIRCFRAILKKALRKIKLINIKHTKCTGRGFPELSDCVIILRRDCGISILFSISTNCVAKTFHTKSKFHTKNRRFLLSYDCTSLMSIDSPSVEYIIAFIINGN